MREQPNDGGPAFPSDRDIQTSGMPLRDYFAAAALQGQLSTEQGFAADSDKIAQWSYQLADAMLAARGQEDA
jgi:hypothetical protein